MLFIVSILFGRCNNFLRLSLSFAATMNYINFEKSCSKLLIFRDFAALVAVIFLSVHSALALPTSTIIIRFLDEKYFLSSLSDPLWQGAKPVFPELRRSGSHSTLLSAKSPILGKLRLYAEINIPAGSEPMDFLRKIRANHGIEYADFARISQIQEQISNDSLQDKQWGLRRIHADKAWKISTGKGIIVGVLDTGVDFFHPDLAGQLAVNSAEDINHNGAFEPWPATEKRNGISGDLDGIDNDGNGFTDDVIGYDFVDQSIVNLGDYAVRDPIPFDEHGHGTSVAGIIAAKTNNRIGIAGIAPDAKIKVLRCHDATGNAEEDDIAAAIVYAAMNGVRVLNMSFGDVVNTPLIRDALAFATSYGCVLVASAGNDGADFSRFPASYPNVIAVAASTESDRRAPFSSFGSQLALSAPGVNIWTTAKDGKYRSFQGTSASAPHVSAAAALLLATMPDLAPAEVLGILQATAQDIGEKGWDTQFGAGIPDCTSALEAIGRTIVRIDSPQNDAVITADSLPVFGTVLTPLFSSWTLCTAAGENPNGLWHSIDSGSVAQGQASLLGTLRFSAMPDTVYTLRLKVNLLNGNTMEHRARIALARKSSFPAIASAEAIPIWRDDERAVLVTVTTDHRSRCIMNIISENDRIYVDNERLARRHEFMLPAAQAHGEADIICYYPNSGDSSSVRIQLPHVAEAFPTGGFQPKPYSAPAAQICNYVRDFFHDGKPSFALNDISSGSFGDTKLLQFDSDKMREKSNTTEQWIPRGLGDSNGDGIMEILAHSFADARLFQGKTLDDSPFSDTLFTQKSVSFASRNDFYSAGMFDIDGDGHEEIFGFSDTACLAYTYKNGKYSLLAAAPNDSPRDAFGSPNAMRPPVCFADDFDGDGKKELLYGDTDADFLIFEYDIGKFTREFLLSNDGKGGTDYCVPADVDGDGKKEILIGYHSQQEFTDDREYEPPIWTFKLLKSYSPNTYTVVWEDHFYGVRVGSGYANGVAAGELDGRKGDEIALFIFPNAYVIRWDSIASTFRPMWFSPFQYSNTAIIYDFDKNGINELGYCDGTNTVFAEYSPDGAGPGVPIGFRGFAKDAHTAVLHWSPAQFATEYQVFAMRNPTSSTTTAELIATTSDTTTTLDTLAPNALYRFYLRARRLGAVQPTGAFALPIDIFTHEPLQPLSAQWKNNAVYIRFSAGYLPSKTISERIFFLISGSKKIPADFVQNAGDSILILRFDTPLPDGILPLEIGSFADRFGTPSVPGLLYVAIQNNALFSEMTLLRLKVINPQILQLQFSEKVRANEAIILHNYSLQPAGIISSIEMSGDSSVRILLDAPLEPIGKEYTLTASNINSTNGVPIAKGAGNTLGFILYGLDNSDAYCYPNPYHHNTGTELIFAGLPRNSDVVVYDMNMRQIATLHDSRGDGGIRWTPMTAAGEPLPTGVYLFKASGMSAAGEQIETGLIKFGIIR